MPRKIKSLIETNLYLKDPSNREALVSRSVKTSGGVEGIKVVRRSKNNKSIDKYDALNNIPIINKDHILIKDQQELIEKLQFNMVVKEVVIMIVAFGLGILLGYIIGVI